MTEAYKSVLFPFFYYKALQVRIDEDHPEIKRKTKFRAALAGGLD